jgi:hypothetical protein
MTCHLEPVQFLLHPMKGIVADFVFGSHGKNGLPGGLHGSAIHIAVRGAAGIGCVAIG